MIKLVFSDVDGTFVREDEYGHYTISKENREAVEQAQKSGIHFALATGRPIDFIPRTYGKKYTYDTVGYTGAYVFANQEVLYQSTFTYEEALTISKAISYQDAVLLCITPNNDYIFNRPEKWAIEEFESDNNVPDHRQIFTIPLEEYQYLNEAEEFCSLVLICPKLELLQELVNTIMLQVGHSYDPVQTRRDGFSFMKKGISKASGIQCMAEYYHIPIHEIAVFGDSNNDVEMFDFIEESYGMKDSRPIILQKAKYIVESVSEGLNKIMMENEKERIQ